MYRDPAALGVLSVAIAGLTVVADVIDIESDMSMRIQKLKNSFADKGITFSDWAKANGFKYRTVIAVINGTNKGRYGEAHQVAVALGIKNKG